MVYALESQITWFRRLPLRWAVGLIAMGMAADDARSQAAAPARPAATVPAPAQGSSAVPAQERKVFFSGHSLLAPPIPEFTQAIARSQGIAMGWNQQSIGGSPIRLRTQGRDPNGPLWNGYREGEGRDGKPIDVLSELKTGASVGGVYDTLVITEMHHSLGSMIWHDTVRYLRHFHERFIAANPRGTTWFYESWLDVSDKDDPRRWIAFEREASVGWQCMAARVNVSLALEGRADRIRSLPAGMALVHLVERATQGPALAGITRASSRLTVDGLLKDDVHLTRLGSYYLALVIDAMVFDRSPVGAWRPDDIDTAAAASAQAVAWEFVQGQKQRTPRSLEQCRAYILDGFLTRYWAYVRDVAFLKQYAAPKAYLDWAKFLVQWHYRLRRNDASNPLHFDPKTDASNWLPAP